MNNAFASATVLVAATLAGCGGDLSIRIGGAQPLPVAVPVPVPVSGFGTPKASNTDGPACGFDAVNISIAKVRLHRNSNAAATDSGWAEISLNPARKIDLPSLGNGALAELGTVTLPSGHYPQIRLVLATGSMANSVVPRGAGEHKLDLPAAAISGISVRGGVDVVAGQQAALVIDVDACASVFSNGIGSYVLRPVAKQVPTVPNGISGLVSATLLSRNVAVSAQQGGTVIGAAAPNVNTGEFLLARLAPGFYDLVITADGSSVGVIGGIPVPTTSSVTLVSTVGAPITLPSSLGGSIAGAARLLPQSAITGAYVAAKLTIASGPVVTIKYAGADVLTGAYTLARVPLNAPLYAAYSATLPLVFAPAAVLTPGIGKYQVDALASGYAPRTYPLPVDISVANAFDINVDLVP